MPAITVELPPELEERLRDKALARGLSTEGYLLTLIEAIASSRPDKSAPPTRSMLSLLRKKGAINVIPEEEPDAAVGEAIRHMRESVQAYKEQAVEAVTAMNMLQAALKRQEQSAAEKELQATHALNDNNRAKALQLFQEKTVMERNLDNIRRELSEATEIAEAKTVAFHQEQEQLQARASRAEKDAFKAYQKVILTPEVIERLIPRIHSQPEWEQFFDTWAKNKGQAEE